VSSGVGWSLLHVPLTGYVGNIQLHQDILHDPPREPRLSNSLKAHISEPRPRDMSDPVEGHVDQVDPASGCLPGERRRPLWRRVAASCCEFRIRPLTGVKCVVPEVFNISTVALRFCVLAIRQRTHRTISLGAE